MVKRQRKHARNLTLIKKKVLFLGNVYHLMNGADLWRLSLWRPDFISNVSYEVLFCLYVSFKHPFTFTLVCAKFTVMYCSVTIASFSVYIHQTFGVLKKS